MTYQNWGQDDEVCVFACATVTKDSALDKTWIEFNFLDGRVDCLHYPSDIEGIVEAFRVLLAMPNASEMLRKHFNRMPPRP